VLVKAVECGECKSIVYSRTKDDVRQCSCGRVIVSGGLQHFNYEALHGTLHEVRKIEVRTTPDMLYDDWYESTDVFGLICPETSDDVSTSSVYIA
tara:strand:- start:705 stop:989 length:285 start_codon:yes stop_codon:yes gene_type:complete